MRGFVDRVADGVIEGWIVNDAHNGNEPTLRVFVDDTEVAQGFVTRMRPDVVAAGHTTGPSGFVIPFSVFHHRHLPCVVRVVEGRTGWPVPPGPIRFDPGPANPVAVPLTDLEPRIADRIARAESREAILADLGVLMRQFSHAVYRATAMSAIEDKEQEFVRRAIFDSRDLGGALGHFAGVIAERYPPLEFPSVAQPEVSIIIPVHNAFDLTYQCLKSIYRNPQSATFEIVLVDDLSRDETLLSALAFTGAVRILRNARQLGFGGACNAGAAVARGRHLFFLNNDTRAHGAWLDALVETLEDPKVGIVGSRLLNPDFSLQECGGLVSDDGVIGRYGRGGDALHPDFRFLRDADCVSGAALMIPADLFRALGGFDAIYEPAGYEDADLCFRARREGYAVRVQPGSTIVHLGGRSKGANDTSSVTRQQGVNQLKFVRRWRDELRTHGDAALHPQRHALRRALRRALFVDDAAPKPDRDAGSANALAHMRALVGFGYHVVFAPGPTMADAAPYTARLEQEGIECAYAPFYRSLEDWLRRRGAEIDLVYLHRFGNAHRFMALVRHYCPDAVVLYNVADLHSLRQQREAALGLRFREGERISDAREFELIASADLAIVSSSYELELARERAPGANVHCIAWPHETTHPLPGFAHRSGLGFVGGYRHRPNVDAMEWFAAEIRPKLQTLQPELCLDMAGSDMPEALLRLQSETMRPVGHVEDLDGFLMRLRATVAPLRCGAGLKAKVLASLAAGTPCVMTSIAAEGMDLPDALGLCVADEPMEIARRLDALTTNEALWSAVSAAGLEFIRSRYSRARIHALLAEAIDGARRRKQTKAGP